MKKMLLAVTAIGLIFASCKKTEQAANTTNTAVAKHSTAEGGCDPGNPANPADGMGLWHNNGCDVVLAYVNATGDKSTPGIANQVNAYATSTGFSADPDLVAHTNMVLADAYENYAGIVARIADPSVRAYAAELVNDIVTARFPDPSAITYCDYKSVILGFESKVAADPGLTAAQLNAIYTMSSIARYSGDKWWNGTLGSSKLPVGPHTPITGPTYGTETHIFLADCIGGTIAGAGGFLCASAAAWYYGW